MSNGLVLTLSEAQLTPAEVAAVDVTGLTSVWTEWFPTPHDHNLNSLSFGSTTCWYTVMANILFWEVFIDAIIVPSPTSWIGVPTPIGRPTTVNAAFKSTVWCLTPPAVFGFGTLTAKSAGAGYLEFLMSDLSQIPAGTAHILGGTGFYPVG